MHFCIRKFLSCQESNSQCPKSNTRSTNPKNQFPDTVVRTLIYTTGVHWTLAMLYMLHAFAAENNQNLLPLIVYITYRT